MSVLSDNVHSSQPRAFRWRLKGAVKPDFAPALRLGEATRAVVLRAWQSRGHSHFPDEFYSGGYWLPEDLDGDGRIDHVILFARNGLPEDLVPILAMGGEIRLRGVGNWRLHPIWMGSNPAGPWFERSRYWRSATPYVTTKSYARGKTRRIRRNRLPEEQLREEIEVRKLPEAISTFYEVRDSCGLATRSHRQLEFRKIGTVELTFSEPVQGPLALGYGAHLGLGLFSAVAKP